MTAVFVWIKRGDLNLFEDKGLVILKALQELQIYNNNSETSVAVHTDCKITLHLRVQTQRFNRENWIHKCLGSSMAEKKTIGNITRSYFPSVHSKQQTNFKYNITAMITGHGKPWEHLPSFKTSDDPICLCRKCLQSVDQMLRECKSSQQEIY